MEADPVTRSSSLRAGLHSIAARRVDRNDKWQPERSIDLVEEDVLTVEIEDIGSYALMWTPTRQLAGNIGYTAEDGLLGAGEIPEAFSLAVGFAFTEGIVDGMSDIANLAMCAERTDVVRMRLKTPAAASVRRRNVIMNSSCGICGGREQIEQGIVEKASVGDRLTLGISHLASVRAALDQHQDIFSRTGGAHGVAVFDGLGHVLALAEDIGRHNALDKAIGQILIEQRDRAGLGVFVSSRISYEMVAKAARAGFEVVVAISAATSLAVRLAERIGITLCGFARGDGAEVYCHPHRIIAD